jgi:hypothetical protein
MRLKTAWVLLLVLGMVGCGEKPTSVVDPEPVAEAAEQSPSGPDVGRDAAIAKIKKMGGKVSYDEESPDRTILTVDLRGKRVTDAGLEHLKGMTSLKLLLLDGTKVTDAGLEHLKGLTNLKELSLGNTQVTEGGVNELKKALPNCEIYHRPA